MKFFLAFALSFSIVFVHAQNASERKGFLFGAAVGASSVSLSSGAVGNFRQAGLSFPNMKFGYFFSPKMAVVLVLPGSVYAQNWEGRKRDRGFEGIVPGIQFWPKDRWWLLGGAGLGLDAPAFYDIKDESERKFHFGGAAIVGTGWEFFRRGRFSLDLQGRAHFGSINAPEGRRTGAAFSVLLGINWF